MIHCPTTLYIFARAVERQSAIYTENSGFASPTLGQHISTFRGYRILFSIRNLERKDSMAECYQRASERAYVTFPLFVFGQGTTFFFYLT
jgi:hypothetical protein